MKRGFKVGDLVTPGTKWYRDRGINASANMGGPMFWDEQMSRAVAVKWETPGIVVGVTLGGVLGPKRSSSDPNSLDLQVLFEGRVLHCDRDRLSLI